MRPRTIDDEELLELLLRAFAELGFEGTSVRALCRHLGVSHNMVHQRYRSKEAAWYAAMDHGFAQLRETLGRPIGSDDPWVVLRTSMSRFAEATLAQPALARIIMHEASRPGPRFEYLLANHIGPIQRQSTASLYELQARGEIRPGPVDLVWFFGVAWGVGGLASSHRLANDTGRSADVPRATTILIDVLLDGLRSGPRPAAMAAEAARLPDCDVDHTGA